MVGIYKITNPLGKIYIGESKNIEKRWYYYKILSCKNQRKLYNSLKKYGPDSHIFEVIEECSFENLYERERYWQEYYNVLSRTKGLNSILTKTNTKKQEISEETRKLNSKSKKGKLSHRKGKPCPQIQGNNHFFFGKKRPEFAESQKGPKNKMYGKIAVNAKKVIDNSTGNIFNSCKEVALFHNIKFSTLRCKLNGHRPNNTNFSYL